MFVDKDIRKAETLPAVFYTDHALFHSLKDKIFASSWQFIGSVLDINQNDTLRPFQFLAPLLPEPLIISKQKDGSLICLSNVCTHRANILIESTSQKNRIVCGYHGRQYELDGTLKFMPEFAEAENFPRPCDHLKKFELQGWRKLLFTSLDPKIDFQKITCQLDERLSFLQLEKFVPRQELYREYQVKAHWALYCDNYLEGFHIPFVHNALNDVLDYSIYETVLGDHMVLQIGYADDNQNTFDLPENHPDHGKNVAAYYYWIFPNLMLNFYPWGLSVNIVKPINPSLTNISFKSYVFDHKALNKGAGGALDIVELEDEAVVESVQKGIQSQSYTRGRFSPTREEGVHYFHWLLSSYLK